MVAGRNGSRYTATTPVAGRGRPNYWAGIARVGGGDSSSFTKYSAIRPELLAELDHPKPSQRPPKEAFSLRLDVLRELDLGSLYKGTLGSSRIDLRDPTADVRLLEFCLAVPMEQFLRNGISKALARGVLADRAPRLVVQEEARRGVQAADWYERLSAAREHIVAELDRLSVCQVTANILDLPRLRKLVENWPNGDWKSDEIAISYRKVLMRAVSIGYFLRRISDHD
jgi:asparagine synthase (glutamine-hydrolysing)